MSAEKPQPEGGEHFGLTPEVRSIADRYDLSEEIAGLAERHGLSAAEARRAVFEPTAWMDMLISGEDPDRVITFVEARIAEYETTYGPSRDWDIMRSGVANSFIACGREDLAARLLTGVQNVRAAIDEVVHFVGDAILNRRLPLSAMEALSHETQDAFARVGRGEEFLAASIALVSAENPPLAAAMEGITGVREADAANFTDARERFRHSPWADLQAVAEDDTLWPDEVAADARITQTIQFGQELHRLLAAQNISRKDAEALKAFINGQQGEHDGEAWDRMRFIAAIGLYDAQAPNFGRTLTRSMRTPEMMAMVVHALVDRGWDRRGMEVMHDIPDPKVFGRMLALGQWQDRAAIDALTEEITHVTPKTIRKHDPALRVGVAEGLSELYEDIHVTALEAGDEQNATPWGVAAETMRSRAALLRRQVESGYIKPIRKK